MRLKGVEAAWQAVNMTGRLRQVTDRGGVRLWAPRPSMMPGSWRTGMTPIGVVCGKSGPYATSTQIPLVRCWDVHGSSPPERAALIRPKGPLMQLRKRSIRVLATASSLSLAAGLSTLVPGGAARASAPGLGHALADLGSAASAALDPGVIARLPESTTFALSPELAAAYGAPTVSLAEAGKLLGQRGTRPAAVATPAVGTVRRWPALDTVGNSGIPLIGIYLKEYTLQAKGKHIEVWVASGKDEVSEGTKFIEGDCRAVDYDPTVVTSRAAEGLIREFDEKMIPASAKNFSVAPARDGTASLGQFEALGVDFRGDGGSTVTLVDNVRDENFYDFKNNRSYIAGFFAPIFNTLTDRNVMTIDAFDWAHRTGLSPKNEPNGDICKSRPARPRMYEGVFVHEYQHLLHTYTDPDEASWLNEGLSDMGPTFVGYADARRRIHQARAESHIYCFQGYGEIKGPSNPNPNPCGGPQNSLTLGNDEGPGSEVLADYGNAWSFMLYLHDRYGPQIISDLHRDGELQGLASVQRALDKFENGKKVMDVLADYQLMNLLDFYLADPKVKLTGADRAAVTSKSLHAGVNVDQKSAYALPGGAPNGADYVQLRAGKTMLKGNQLTSLSFVGAPTVPDGGPFGDGPDVENWRIRLVGIDEDGKKMLVKSYEKAFALTLNAEQLKAFAPYPVVVAMVTQEDSRELIGQYIPYTLTVNGEVQPGG
jgi:hypothetical protein